MVLIRALKHRMDANEFHCFILSFGRRDKERVGRWKVRTHVAVLYVGFLCDRLNFLNYTCIINFIVYFFVERKGL